jgi:hypothetical protein
MTIKEDIKIRRKESKTIIQETLVGLEQEFLKNKSVTRASLKVKRNEEIGSDEH